MLSSVTDTQKVVGYIDLCRRMGIRILSPDINASFANFSVDGEAIRFGLAGIRNIGEAAMQNVSEIREAGGAFKSFQDFCNRVDSRVLNKRAVESLIKCGAFDAFGARRSQLLAVMDRVMGDAARQQRDRDSGQMGLFTEEIMEEAAGMELPDIPEADAKEILAWEKEITGFYITGHPLDRYRDKLRNFNGIDKLIGGGAKDRQLARVAGMVAMAKRITTKKGETMCFITLEDFSASVEITVFPRTFYQHVNLLVPDMPIVVQGRVDAREDGIVLLADSIWSLEEYLPEYYLTIAPELANQAVYDRLKAVFAGHHGMHPVYMHANGRWQKAQEQYWLDGSPEAYAEVTEILGKGSVRVR